jgi:integrase
MPAKFLMSWEGSPQYRWVKQKDGVKHRVTCVELNLPQKKWTKEDSYLYANDWWRKKLLGLGQTTPELDPEKLKAIQIVDRLIDWAASNDPAEVPKLREQRKAIEQSDPDSLPLLDQEVIDERVQIAAQFGIHIPQGTDALVLQDIFGNRRIHQDRLKRHGKVKEEQTVGYCLDLFLEQLRLKQEPATHQEINDLLRAIPESVWSREMNVEAISEQTVLGHYRWLAGLNLGAGSHNKRLGFFRRFVVWLYEQRMIENLPRNLKSKDHRRKLDHEEVKTFDQIKEFVDQLPATLRTWAMLCLNCGMTAADLGSLFWADNALTLGDSIAVGQEKAKVMGLIDANSWSIRRRRSKTGKNPKTPTVTYKLWPETIALLKELPRHSPLVFVTENGSPMYVSKYTETTKSKSKVSRKDLFGDYWRGQRINLGKLRSVAADMLYGHELYRQYKDYFLAHKPNTMADKHYGKEKDDPFFRALEFIRKSIFG